MGICRGIAKRSGRGGGRTEARGVGKKKNSMSWAALKGTNLRGQTPICGFLRAPACGFRQFPAEICGFCENLCFPNAKHWLNIGQKSAKIGPCNSIAVTGRNSSQALSRTSRTCSYMNQKWGEYGFGEYGVKHRTQ